jgi:cyanophycinase-like exopeptidase
MTSTGSASGSGTRPRLLTIMGSGETAPTMMKVHRDLIARLGPADAVRAVVLDTPYGFQENAPELAQRAQEYFRTSVGHPIEVAGLQRLQGEDPLVVEQGLARVRTADYLFAGPGSPSYALRQWAGSALNDLVHAKMRHGGAVTFASAAALTLGRVTVPVYEIYKVGEEPRWLEGLDLLAEVGLPVAVIPHYDNAEGGRHDTRFCYLGERRLRVMEAMLPVGVHVLGVDEHTGVVLDLDADTATVVGHGGITVRIDGRSTVYPTGTTLPIDALRDPAAGVTAVGRAPTAGSTVDAERTDAGAADEPAVATSLAADTAVCEARFDAALAARDANGAARAALDLDSAITAWSADTLQSDEADRARAALRSMITRLGDAAVAGLRDPAEVLAPAVEVALAVRAAVRAEKRFDLSDLIRDGFAAAGIEVRDTPDGVVWVLLDD